MNSALVMIKATYVASVCESTWNPLLVPGYNESTILSCWFQPRVCGIFNDYEPNKELLILYK